MIINCSWCALLIVAEYSDASIGRVALLPLFNVLSVLTITQLLPVAPCVVVKMKPTKLDLDCISAVVRPVPPRELATCPVDVISQ
jgi:hypothetical protein